MARFTFVFALAILLAAAVARGAPVPIYSGVPIYASLKPNETVCYQFSLDENVTREVVYWPAAKLFVRLQPCTGTPHLRASVHGCPSDGHIINFEFQNTKSRNDMLAKNLTVPPQWEWMGDTETLSLDVTHRNFFIEVTQFHPPLRTNESKADLARRLRNKKLDQQAEVVNDMIFKGTFGFNEAVYLRSMQEMVMPPAKYELLAYLHDSKEFPDTQFTPLASTPGFKRDIEMVNKGVLTADDANFGAYVIAWYAPTWKAPAANETNTSNSSTGTATATGGPAGAAMRRDASAEEEESDGLPHHARRLLAMREGGAKDVTWGQVEDLLSAEPWAAEQLSAARALLSPEDVIFYAHPGVANARRAPEPQLTSRQLHALKLADPSHPAHERTKEEEAKRAQVLNEAERKLAELAEQVSPDTFSTALERGAIELEERKAALASSRTRRSSMGLTTRAITNSSAGSSYAAAAASSGTAGGMVARELSLLEKAQRPLIDEELEYLIFWVDITQFVRDRWGVMQDGLRNDYTRLFDFNATKGFYCEDPDRTGRIDYGESSEGLCGIHQVIARQEFGRLDKLGNGDGRLQRAEIAAEFPPNGNAAFKKGWDWDKAVKYQDEKMLSGSGLALRAWEESFGSSQAIFDASLKDPLLRTYWTLCGLNDSATPLGVSGNVSKDASTATWLGYKSFDRDDKGRLTRAMQGLEDNDNNVYIVNVVVRHVVTKEMVAYKPHVLQRRSPIYEAAETGGPQQMAVIWGVVGAAAGIVFFFILAIIYTSKRKTRPKLRIVKHGPTGPLLGQVDKY